MNDLEVPAVESAVPAEPAIRADAAAETAVSASGFHAGRERQRNVPYGALAEERARRKELQRELQESLAMRQDLLGQLAQLQARTGPASIPGQPMEQGSTAAGAESEHMASAPLDGAGRAPDPRASEESALRTQVLQSVRAFSAERPDFLAAYEHARSERMVELIALGYRPEEAVAITFDNEMQVIRNAYASGRNPAQVIYDYAVQRGYQGARPQAPTARPVQGGMTEADKVALAARGQARSKSLSSAGGGAVATLTLEALAGMTDAEFAEATKGNRWQRLLRE